MVNILLYNKNYKNLQNQFIKRFYYNSMLRTLNSIYASKSIKTSKSIDIILLILLIIFPTGLVLD